MLTGGVHQFAPAWLWATDLPGSAAVFGLTISSGGGLRAVIGKGSATRSCPERTVPESSGRRTLTT